MRLHVDLANGSVYFNFLSVLSNYALTGLILAIPTEAGIVGLI